MSANTSVKVALQHAHGLTLLDTQLLLAHALKTTRVALYSHDDRLLTDAENQTWLNLLEQRRKGMPVAYLLGEKECFGLDFYVTPDVLIPRPDTECLIETALSLCADTHILDLGTGSGVIACAIALAKPECHVLATDISDAALQIAQRNITRHALKNVTTRLSDGFDTISESFGLIISNPPYLAPDDPHLSGEIRFEPMQALVADEQGFAVLRRVINGAMMHLCPDGYICLEHGFEQAAGVGALLEQAGFEQITTVKDLAGNDRVTHAKSSTLHSESY